MKRNLTILITVILVLSMQSVIGQDWEVPTDKINISNPSEYNIQNVKKGKELYIKNCKSCHGDAGKNNALPLLPLPPDVTSEKMQGNSEGELFYKITHGKGTMPQFETSLSEDDRWRVVNYIMNFNPEKEPLLIDAPPIKAKILASVNEEESKIDVFAEYQDKEGSFVKLTNAPVIINIKKTFGKLAIGQVTTNEDGRAEYRIPETVIGDEKGLVNFVISLNENYEANELVIENAKVAEPNIVPSLFDHSSLWSTNERIQLWLLLSYIGAAGGAWLAIAYVILQIIKIKRLGKE